MCTACNVLYALRAPAPAGQSTGFPCPRQYDVSIIDRDLHFPMIRTGIISIIHT